MQTGSRFLQANVLPCFPSLWEMGCAYSVEGPAYGEAVTPSAQLSVQKVAVT